MTIDISVIIVNYNTKHLLQDCITSLKKHIQDVSYEIIVVDNASVDESSAMVSALFPDVKLIQNKTNVGFGAANNIGAAIASGEYLLLFNSDAELITDTVAQLFMFLKTHPQTAVAGPGVLLPDRTRQPKICGELPTLARLCYDALYISTLFQKTPFFSGIYTNQPGKGVLFPCWVSGVCMLITSDVYKEVNGFDPDVFLYCEDMDLCIRIRNVGWQIAHISDRPIVHRLGGSAKSNEDIIRNSLLQQKYFIYLLSKIFPPQKLFLSRCILGCGLILRLIAGTIQMYLYPRKNTLLMDTARARLKTVFK